MILHTDCRHFRGDVPCKPHKLYGVHCDGCEHYDPAPQRILIIKLGAIGDVIRTTPLLTPLRKAYPNAVIYWLTHSPEVLPASVDHKLTLRPETLLMLEETSFDYAINLDKEREACALLNRVDAKVKKGFALKDGKCAPLDAAAEHKFNTGLFDDLSRSNTKSYLVEMFDIAGFTFNGEKYVLENSEAGKRQWKIDKSKPVTGLNTGCGGRWTSRLWPEERWRELALQLLASGHEVILLGGEQEHEKNTRLAAATGATYFGHFPLKTFIDLIGQCDSVVTQVTMGMHLTLGLGKRLVLLNNIFNRHEFELYGNGEIIEPSTGCECYFAASCKREAPERAAGGEHHCMIDISVGRVADAVLARQAKAV
ncbi:MAG: glycosyltransferase family 9 protein [Rhizobacter sp.]|nr:glycosyltransferase family 9 protein [Chlorobiales bacterium]